MSTILKHDWPTFLGVPDAAMTAMFAMLPLPFEGAVSYGHGTADGPAAIWDASAQVELWDPVTKVDLASLSYRTADPPRQGSDLHELMENIEAAAIALHRHHQHVIGVGGDHSVTPPLIRAAVAAHKVRPSELTVVHIDAHADLRDSYNGTKNSHASCMARALDLGARVLSIGIRSAEREEVERGLATGRVQIHWAHQLQQADAIEIVCQQLRGLTGPIYLTIDIDAFEPALCPATGTPEPGGMGWWTMRQIVSALLTENTAATLLGMDLVETAPMQGTAVNEFTAAKLLGAMIAAVHQRAS